MKTRKENLVGWAFIAPALLAFLIFIAFPFFSSIGLSFTSWNFIGGWKKLKWVGFQNFIDIWYDDTFRHAIVNTFIYAIAVVPTSILVAMVLAYVLNGEVYFKKILRMAFFIPYISSTVALAAVFKFMFRDDGIINSILETVFHMKETPAWLGDPVLNRIPIIVLSIWTSIGYEMVIYMAALQNVPANLYEAADVDGASGWTKFWKITFPMISPTTFYLVIVRLIAIFKIFTSINIMTMATAASSNTSMVVEIYSNAFSSYKFGYASAEAMILFMLILLITRFQFWAQKKWVYY